MAVAETTNMFCPHLSFKVTHTRNNESHGRRSMKKISLSGNDEVEGNVLRKRLSADAVAAALSGNLESVSRSEAEETVSESHIACHDCNDLGVANPPRSPYHLWRCLEPKCKLLLCGKQIKNHSQSHCQEYPSHVLQENAASKRIWCNECNHEVFTDHRNRRGPPGVWTPGTRMDDEIPRGLYNIGNTCFMNAALQCMMAVNPLSSYMLGQCSSFQGRNVAQSYFWLLSEMWSDDPYKYQKGVMPSRLLHSVRATHPIFRGFQQHDTQEFLRLFMDTLAEETRVPHFIYDDVEEKKEESRGSEDDGSSDSETESFETCDSGNASEETMSTDVNNGESTSSNPLKDVKVVMRSVVSDIFDGQIESSAQCLSCKQVSSRIEVFQDLSLPIPTREELLALKKYEKFEQDEFKRSVGWIEWIWDWVKSFMWGPAPTLEDCFAAFFSSDELKGKNMYSCEKCKKLRNGVKRCSLYHLPEVLCVHLKRFRMYEYSGGMGFSGKLSQYVQFPLDTLELAPFLNKDCPNQITTYRLLGIICHIGSFLGGHYVAYVRRGDHWYLCDDARVVEVSSETVAQSEAYVLFYQKYNPDADDSKQALIDEWTQCEDDYTNNAAGAGDMKFQLISRKWLTQFFWGEEVGPIINSDVICPHGFMIPYEFSHFGATWVPQPIWNTLVERYGGGPSLSYSEECVICAAAWRKHIKSVQKSNASLDSSSDRE